MQVNLDSKTRLQTMSSLSRPSAHTFEQSQRRIESLMEKDSYQRFLRSDLYHALFTCRPAPSSTTSPLLLSPQPPSPQQQHIPPLPTASSSSALSPSPVRSPRSSSRPGLLDWCSPTALTHLLYNLLFLILTRRSHIIIIHFACTMQRRVKVLCIVENVLVSNTLTYTSWQNKIG